MTLRIEAGLRPSRFERESVREPTGSPVEIKVSTIAVRTSRSRLPILGSDGIDNTEFPDSKVIVLSFGRGLSLAHRSAANHFRCKSLAERRIRRALLGF